MALWFEGKLRQYQNQQVSVTMQNTKRDRPLCSCA